MKNSFFSNYDGLTNALKCYKPSINYFNNVAARNGLTKAVLKSTPAITRSAACLYTSPFSLKISQ